MSKKPRKRAKAIGLSRLEMSRSAHGAARGLRRSSVQMSERGLHSIGDDLSETWFEDWAGAGIAEIEDYLAKHAAFLAFLEAHDAVSS